MRNLIFSRVLAIMLCIGNFAASAKCERRPLQIIVTTQSEEFDPATPIDLKIVVENISNEVQTYHSAEAVENFEFSVIGEDDEAVPLTSFGKGKKLPGSFGSHHVITVKVGPGKSVVYGIRINHLFDMSKLEQYRITVSRVPWDPEESGFAPGAGAVKVRTATPKADPPKPAK